MSRCSIQSEIDLKSKWNIGSSTYTYPIEMILAKPTRFLLLVLLSISDHPRGILSRPRVPVDMNVVDSLTTSEFHSPPLRFMTKARSHLLMRFLKCHWPHLLLLTFSSFPLLLIEPLTELPILIENDKYALHFFLPRNPNFFSTTF